MIDWLVIWGVTQAAGVVVYPILESLAQDAAKDYSKDFFKDCLKKVIRLPEPDVLKEAYGKALKEFLELIEYELKEEGYKEAIIKHYKTPLQNFIKREEVSASLGMAFNVECKAIDTALLVRVWTELNSPHLPEDINWDFLSKSYIRSVKKIVQNSDKLRPIFEVQTLDKIADAVQEVAGIAPAFDLEKYAEGLREQYGNLKLESLDTTGVYYNELKLWKIFIPQNLRECQEFIPQVYELPKDRARLLQESGQLDALELAEVELENHRKRYVEQPIRGVFEVLGDPKEAAKDGVAKYAVILGDPGSGKSTLLQYLALIWAERPVRDLPLYPLPLLLELRTYARDKQAGKCKDIVSFIHGGNITCRLNQQELHENLNRGDVIALFDGIDEVFDPALRDEVVTDIHRFTNEYPAVRAVATSRWLGYKAQRLRDAGFQHLMLQELDDGQMQDFVVRWHDLNFAEGADKERKRERLQKAIRESRSIKELAGNPLLLTMMAILNRNQELPRDRPELYNQASRVLLHQWDVERALVEDSRIDPKTIDYRDKQAMLRKVAYFMQSSAKGLAGNLISAVQLESILTDYLKTIEVEKPREIARIMIGQLRTRNFILCDLGGDSYGFVHRTFLEYFCAWEFVWQFKESQTLTIEQLIDDVFGNHWQDESWHEVLRLISGMIEPRFVADIIDFLLEQKVDKRTFLEINRQQNEGVFKFLLAIGCLIELRNRSLIAGSLSKLLKKAQSELLDGVLGALLKLEDNIEFLKKIYNELLEYHLLNFTEADTLKVIIEMYSLDRLILQYLRIQESFDDFLELSIAGESYQWSCEEIEEEIKYWEQAIKVILRDSKFIQSVGVSLIRTYGCKSNSLEIVDHLSYVSKDILFPSESKYHLEPFILRFKKFTDNPDTITFLKDRVLNVQYIVNDHFKLVRKAAVQAIFQGWKDDPDTLPLLKDRAFNDQYEGVRSAAIASITKGWKDYPQTFDFLCDRAIHDPFKREEDWQDNPRQTALEGILKHYSDKPQTLEILKAIANNDPDEKFKEFAKKELAKIL